MRREDTFDIHRAPEVKKFFDALSTSTFGQTVGAATDGDTCRSCKKAAVEFTDSLSRHEYRISGLCQSCQDVVFAPEEDIELPEDLTLILGEPLGEYYTPANIDKIVDPAVGTGGFLTDVVDKL